MSKSIYMQKYICFNIIFSLFQHLFIRFTQKRNRIRNANYIYFIDNLIYFIPLLFFDEQKTEQNALPFEKLICFYSCEIHESQTCTWHFNLHIFLWKKYVLLYFHRIPTTQEKITWHSFYTVIIENLYFNIPAFKSRFCQYQSQTLQYQQILTFLFLIEWFENSHLPTPDQLSHIIMILSLLLIWMKTVLIVKSIHMKTQGHPIIS